jgi:hypothetical protein
MKYRKKPVVIDAVQVPDPDNDVAAWEAMCAFLSEGCDDWGALSNRVEIGTLEGTMTAGIGDWIIRGIKGEYYPCKPDIFAATYDSVE